MSAAILATRDTTELSRMLELWRARFGVRGFSFAQARRIGSAFVDDTLLSIWPADILSEFTADGLYHHDPVLKRFMTAVESFAWDVSIYSESDPNELRLRQIRARCGVTGGVWWRWSAPACRPVSACAPAEATWSARRPCAMR